MSSDDNLLVNGRDICDILEETAISVTETAQDDSIIQLASCPRAHASVQGMVERRFHPIHLRDFYSVINYLLLYISTLREDGGGEEDSEVTKLRKQVIELQQKNKERKGKYEELYRINQQWSADYKDLQKQLENLSETCTENTCTACITTKRESQHKSSIIHELTSNIEKLKVKDKECAKQLKDKEDMIQDLLNECSALRYQFQEIGGLTVAMKLKDDKKELTREINKLRIKNTELERERSRIQTQLNRFKQSVRQLLFNASTYNTTLNHTTHYSSPRQPQYTTPPHNEYEVRIPPGMASEGYVYPKQFAPRTSKNIRYNLTTTNTSGGAKQPPTPPGLMSRGKLLGEGYYEPHPYKPHTITEQVIPINAYPKPVRLSNQYLEPKTPQHDILLSPLTSPTRPMSAPGSLLITQHTDHTPSDHTPSDYTHNSSSMDNLFNDHAHTTNEKPRPTTLKLELVKQDGYHSNDITPPLISGNDHTHFYCPQCNMAFPRQPDSCDSLLEHLVTCEY